MRKVLPVICIIILLLTSCVFGILYFTSSDDEENTPEEQQHTTPLRSTVESGFITSTITSAGNVVSNSPDIYIENISVYFENESDGKNFTSTHKVGDVLQKGDVLYVYNKKMRKLNTIVKL